jgi:hypothetical protein
MTEGLEHIRFGFDKGLFSVGHNAPRFFSFAYLVKQPNVKVKKKSAATIIYTEIFLLKIMYLKTSAFVFNPSSNDGVGCGFK